MQGVRGIVLLNGSSQRDAHGHSMRLGAGCLFISVLRRVHCPHNWGPACPPLAYPERLTSAGGDRHYVYLMVATPGRNIRICLPISLEASARQRPLRLSNPGSPLAFGFGSSTNLSKFLLSSVLSSLICQVGIITLSWWGRGCVVWSFGSQYLS